MLGAVGDPSGVAGAETADAAEVPTAFVATTVKVYVTPSVSGEIVLTAMRAHATQVRVWIFGPHAAFALSDGVARPVFDTEHFTLASGVAEGACDDLFGGLPLGSEGTP